MKNSIIVLWLLFAAFFLFPMGVSYVSGAPESEVIAIIEKESEADNIQVTAVEDHGNKAMYAFTAGDDYGVAVFSHIGDNYDYQEGTMSNGEDYIAVNLDAGWDVYEYKVTADGAKQMAFHKFDGVYKMYAIIVVIMIIASIAGAIYAKRMNKKHEEQRRKGLRQ